MVEAQMQLGFSVNSFGVGDLVEYINGASDGQVEDLIEQYRSQYTIPLSESQMDAVADSARIEAGMRNFLSEGVLQSVYKHFRRSSWHEATAGTSDAKTDGRWFWLRR